MRLVRSRKRKRRPVRSRMRKRRLVRSRRRSSLLVRSASLKRKERFSQVVSLDFRSSAWLHPLLHQTSSTLQVEVVISGTSAPHQARKDEARRLQGRRDLQTVESMQAEVPAPCPSSIIPPLSSFSQSECSIWHTGRIWVITAVAESAESQSCSWRTELRRRSSKWVLLWNWEVQSKEFQFVSSELQGKQDFLLEAATLQAH